jgi:hypothetical protein
MCFKNKLERLLSKKFPIWFDIQMQEEHWNKAPLRCTCQQNLPEY